MLTSLRKTSGSFFVKLLFVLLIASFAIWGIGDVLRTSPGDGPIEVGERTISVQAIDREFRGLLDQQGRALGFRLEPIQGIQFGLLDQAISNLVSRALIDNLAADAGLRIDDATIAAFIRDRMGHRTADGRFDRAGFEQELRARGVTEQMFVEQLRLDIARQEMLQALVGGVRIPDPIADTLRAYREETRIADYVRVSADAMPAPEEPDDATLQAYYEEHGDDYLAPEYRSGLVVLLDPDVMAADITVEEEQLEEEYLYRRDQLFIPEERQVEQMILPDAAAAEAAEAALAEGRDFAEVAAEIAGQDPSGLIMGSFTEDEWFVPEAAEALFGGEVGAVSPAVETPLGWRIYRLAGIEPAREPTLDDVRDQLRQEIAHRIAQDSLFDLSGQLQDEIAGGATLAEAAEAVGLTVETIPAVSASGTGPDDGEVAVPGGQPVRDALFATEPGAPSDRRDLANGGVFFVEVSEVTEPSRRPFEAVRDRVLADWTREQQTEAARARATAIEEALATGVPLADAVAEYGLEVAEASGVRRDGTQTGGLPRDLAARLFEMEPGDGAMSQGGAGAFYVARLREVVPVAPDAEAEKEVWLRMSAELTNDVLQALGGVLHNRHQPRVQQEAIRQTFLQSYGRIGAGS